MKWCPRCKEHKPVKKFSKNKSQNDGLQVYCKECWRKYNKTPTARNRPSQVKNWIDWIAGSMKDSDY